MKNFLFKFKWFSIGAFIAWFVLPAIVYAVNITVPQATQKGDIVTGLAAGNYQLQHPCSNGLVLAASSTSSTGWACVSTSGSSGLVSLNGATGPAITLATGTAGTIFNLASSSNAFTLNLPLADATHTGQLQGSDWTIFNNKQASFTFPISYASSTATTTSIIWTDINRGDAYTANGSIVFPYKSIAAMLTAPTSTGAVAYHLAPGTYVSGAPDTFPTVPFALYGNESTYVPASGVTLPGPFDIYDLTIVGNVTETNNSLTTIHQFNNSVVSGNLVLSSNATLSGMALPSTSSKLTILPGALTNVMGSFIQSRIDNFGILNLNDDQLQTGTAGYALTSTTTGAQTIISGLTLINTTANAGGINTANGATSSPNILTNLSMLVNSSTPGSFVNAGTAATMFCNNGPMTNLTGAFSSSWISGSAWIPCYDENRSVLNAFAVGTTTQTSATTFLQGTSGTTPLIVASSSGDSLLTVLGSGFVGIGTSTPLSPLSIVGGGFGTLRVENSNVAGASVELKNNDTGGTNWYLISNGSGNNGGAGPFQFFNANSNKTIMILQSTGNVGIGSNTPGSTLSVKGISGSTPLLTVASSSNASYFNIASNGNVSIPTISGSTQCLHVDTNGLISGTGTDCGGGGSLSGGTNGQLPYWTSATSLSSTSKMLYDGTVFGMNATSSTIGFNIQGTAGTNTIFNVASSSGVSLFSITPTGLASATTLSLAGIPVKATYDKSFQLASTTLDTTNLQFSNATTTWNLWNPSYAVTLTKLYCKTDTGTLLLNFGGNLLSCTSGGASSTPSTNYAIEADVNASLGSAASTPNRVRVTATFQSQ